MLDLHPYLAQPDFEKILPIAPILAEYDARLGKNFEGAAVGDLKNAVPVGTSHNDLLRLDDVAQIQCPRIAVAQDGDLPGERHQLRRAVQIGSRRTARASDCAGAQKHRQQREDSSSVVAHARHETAPE